MATSLERRIALLESAQVKANLKSMTDEELSGHIRALEIGSPAFYDAVIARVLRHSSTFPIVVNDPEHEANSYGIH
ncbi:MAG: hypothetical protein ABIR55_07775 [Burkholderiaceae bacterium]